MNYIFILAASFVTLIWYVRPLYNYFAKRKYVLLDSSDNSWSKKIKSSLPSIIFYTVIFGLMFYPVIANKLLNSVQSGSILLGEIIFIFVLTRYDKRQTKYQISDKGIKYRNKFINWNSKLKIKYKSTIFFVLHKPRFIIKEDYTTITIPLLSSGINSFVEMFKAKQPQKGKLVYQIYHNGLNYYVTNNQIAKEINK